MIIARTIYVYINCVYLIIMYLIFGERRKRKWVKICLAQEEIALYCFIQFIRRRTQYSSRRRSLILYYIFTSDYIGQPPAILQGDLISAPYDCLQILVVLPAHAHPRKHNEVSRATRILFLFIAKLTRVLPRDQGSFALN